MFHENDKVLLTAKSIIVAATVLGVLFYLVAGIVSAVLIHWSYCFIIPVGWFFCWILWVFARLFLSFLCDVKLIRNKIYGESNEDLEYFLKSHAERKSESTDDEAAKERLKYWEIMLSSHKISLEEYLRLTSDVCLKEEQPSRKFAKTETDEENADEEDE